MTTHRSVRCSHCKIIYNYQPSGEGCDRETNDSVYCPDCMRVIIDALSKVPEKVEEFWVDCKDVSLDEIKEQLEIIREKGYWQEMCMPLFDLNNHNNHNISGIVRLKGHVIRYSYWTQGEDVSIETKMARNKITGEEYEWEDWI